MERQLKGFYHRNGEPAIWFYTSAAVAHGQ
jgi:hypothetical protein